jgi:hypothetical protein
VKTMKRRTDSALALSIMDLSKAEGTLVLEVGYSCVRTQLIWTTCEHILSQVTVKRIKQDGLMIYVSTRLSTRATSPDLPFEPS